MVGVCVSVGVSLGVLVAVLLADGVSLAVGDGRSGFAGITVLVGPGTWVGASVGGSAATAVAGTAVAGVVATCVG